MLVPRNSPSRWEGDFWALRAATRALIQDRVNPFAERKATMFRCAKGRSVLHLKRPASNRQVANPADLMGKTSEDPIGVDRICEVFEIHVGNR